MCPRPIAVAKSTSPGLSGKLHGTVQQKGHSEGEGKNISVRNAWRNGKSGTGLRLTHAYFTAGRCEDVTCISFGRAVEVRLSSQLHE